MNTDHDLERRITGVFANEAPSGYPEELLGRVLTTTSRIRPRPTWLADIKEPPMRTPSRVVVGSPALRLAATLALTLALALALAGAVAGAASLLPDQRVPTPFGPAGNGSLIYETMGDIYLADADGGNARPIISGDAYDWSPWFSHDGRTIAFARGSRSDYALMLADADGSNIRQILPSGGQWNVEFMPGDQTMVGTVEIDDRRALSVIEVDSGRVTELEIGGLDPNWFQMPRPTDGQEIIFKAHTSADGKQNGLYAIKPDGTGLRMIGEPSTTSDPDLSFQDPVLSPDGLLIGYWNWEPDPDRNGASDSQAHLRDLTSGLDLPLQFDSTDGSLLLHFSPDGTKVAFEGSTDDGSTQHLFVAPLDGSGPSVPVGKDYSYTGRVGFDFSPDGTKVILTQVGGSTIIDLATGEATEVPDIRFLSAWQRLAPLAP